ncbi:MAG: hypothetical protein ACYCS7_05035 [Acidimicrobiales bacterium]
MVAPIRNLGRPGISSMAMAAVDIAPWDGVLDPKGGVLRPGLCRLGLCRLGLGLGLKRSDAEKYRVAV